MTTWQQAVRDELAAWGYGREAARAIPKLEAAVASYQIEAADEAQQRERLRAQRQAFGRMAAAAAALEAAFGQAVGLGKVGRLTWAEGETRVRTGTATDQPFVAFLQGIGPEAWAAFAPTLASVRETAERLAKGGAGGRWRKEARIRLAQRAAAALKAEGVDITAGRDGVFARVLERLLAALGEPYVTDLMSVLSAAAKAANAVEKPTSK